MIPVIGEWICLDSKVVPERWWARRSGENHFVLTISRKKPDFNAGEFSLSDKEIAALAKLADS
ncbi:MAG: hypothetical protein KGL39_55545 [Patescibacteria group bacterium]|nr:hypothetical protein [Patescibacteria group bacterium]